MQIQSRITKERIPWLMAGARAVLGPVMIMGERARWNAVALAVLVLTGLLSDIFDGVIARRWNCDTAAVRLFDSMADIVFYAGCAIALWMRHPSVVHNLALPILGVVGLEALSSAVAFIKFGKLPSYHSYVAKAWGLVLASALIAAFLCKHPQGWILAAIAMGALSNLEGIAMSLIMPVWRQDVKTLRSAMEIRRLVLGPRNSAQHSTAHGDNRKTASLAVTSVVALMMLALVPAAARAASIPSVTFIGGSAPGITTGTAGSMETADDKISFHWTAGSLVIPYSQIRNFSYRDKRVNLGVLPTIVVILFRPSIYHHIVSISYLDAFGNKQVAIFEVPKEAGETLPVVLQERTDICADQYQLPCRTGVSHSSQRPLISSERLGASR